MCVVHGVGDGYAGMLGEDGWEIDLRCPRRSEDRKTV